VSKPRPPRDPAGSVRRDEVLSLRELQSRFGWPDLPHRNRTRHPHYRDVFTARAKDRATEFYAGDLALGYEF